VVTNTRPAVSLAQGYGKHAGRTGGPTNATPPTTGTACHCSSSTRHLWQREPPTQCSQGQGGTEEGLADVSAHPVGLSCQQPASDNNNNNNNNNRAWSTQSLQKRPTNPADRSASRVVDQRRSSLRSMAVSVEWCFLYADWCLGIRPWSLRYSFSCRETAFSTTLDMNERFDTGRKLAMFDMSSPGFLSRGVTSACF